MNKLKIENVVFCENIRAEIGGKHTLLGVFAPELNIIDIPSFIQIAIWVSGVPTGIGTFNGEFRVLSPDGSKLIGGQIVGDFALIAKTSMVLNAFPLQIDKAGAYSFEWNFGQTGWSEIGKVLIHHTPATAAIHPSEK